MIRLALIGKNIAHSQSPTIYRQFFADSLDYQLIDCVDSKLIPSADELMSRYNGVSITSPYKNHFTGHVQMDRSAERAGSINCLYRTEDMGLLGGNTDLLALEELLPRYLSEYQLESVVILGGGPMAKVVQGICERLHYPHSIYCRQTHGDLSGLILTIDKALIVNCCSRAMLFSGSFPLSSVFFDLNYALPHPFLSSLHSFRYIDGAEMLYHQAVWALRLWKLLPDKNS